MVQQQSAVIAFDYAFYIVGVLFIIALPLVLAPACAGSHADKRRPRSSSNGRGKGPRCSRTFWCRWMDRLPRLKAVAVAGEMARRFDSHVTLLHVQLPPGAWLAAPDVAATMTVEAEIALEESAQVVIQGARAALDLPEDRVTTSIVPGHPAETICRLVVEEGYDLIIMGRRGPQRRHQLLPRQRQRQGDASRGVSGVGGALTGSALAVIPSDLRHVVCRKLCEGSIPAREAVCSICGECFIRLAQSDRRREWR